MASSSGSPAVEQPVVVSGRTRQCRQCRATRPRHAQCPQIRCRHLRSRREQACEARGTAGPLAAACPQIATRCDANWRAALTVTCCPSIARTAEFERVPPAGHAQATDARPARRPGTGRVPKCRLHRQEVAIQIQDARDPCRRRRSHHRARPSARERPPTAHQGRHVTSTTAGMEPITRRTPVAVVQRRTPRHLWPAPTSRSAGSASRTAR